ncbi:proteasome subunit beta type-11a [Chanos chanos]|uniref:Proteasome subunit beta type-11a n=1 Tax=Chanos chanos TaxID=29144 RepID=A0A6J2VEY4_CHACN|nr:proteasome subunit beta type-11-like [Chanos chanos]
MALQDICCYLDTLLGAPWNSSSSLSLPFGTEHTDLYSTTSDQKNFFSGTPLERCGGSPLRFFLPPPQIRGQFGKASSFLSNSSPTSSAVARPFPLSHGTTTLGFAFQGGVIAAADTRASCAGLIACPAAHKIQPIHSHLVVTTSGSAADCMLWERILAREIRLYQLRHRRKLSVTGAAKLLSLMLHPFKGTDVCVATTLCGWDRETAEGDEGRTQQDPISSSYNGTSSQAVSDLNQIRPKATAVGRTGPKVCYVCSDGLMLNEDLISVGSGSPYAYSVLDDGWRWKMSVDEAVSLAREAVYRATHRDAYSGNNVDLFHITAHGWSRREREDVKEEYYREKERVWYDRLQIKLQFYAEHVLKFED